MIGTIIGIAGVIGSGKSFTQLKHGLQYVEDRQKQLVTNFRIDVDALKKYASLPKQKKTLIGSIIFDFRNIVYNLHKVFYYYFPFLLPVPKKPRILPHLPWVRKLCESGGIIQIVAPENLQALLIPESVVLLDEAGIFLNSREFAKTPKALLADLAQSRKDGIDLIFAAQFDDQVDRQLRMLCQFWIHCNSISIYNKKLRRPKLYYKHIYWMSCPDYYDWLGNNRVKGNHLKTWLIYTLKYEGGFLDSFDIALFDIYNSFDRLDNVGSAASINTIHQCKLTSDYFFRLKSEEKVISDFDIVDSSFFQSNLQSNSIVSSVKKPNTSQSKSQLIASILKLARQKSIKPPYLKDMSIRDLSNYYSRLVS